MGKAHKVKAEYLDAKEMVELLATLKDIADNKFFSTQRKRDKFRRFSESFAEYFNLLSMTEVKHPLVKNETKKVALIVATIEGGFLGEFNNKMIRKGLEEYKKHEDCELIAVGEKAIDPLSRYQKNIKSFTGTEPTKIYEMAVKIKDYIVDRMMKGEIGKVLICHTWYKSSDVQIPRVLQLLPCDDLIAQHSSFIGRLEKKVLEESSPNDVLGFLINLWLVTRLHSILIDTIVSSALAQSKFLEDALEKMKKEREKVQSKYRKAKKSDIDKSLREIFSAKMMVAK